MDENTQVMEKINSPSAASLHDVCSATTDRIARCVKEEPGKALLYSVGAGLGMGVLIGAFLSGSRSSSNWMDRQTAEEFSRKMMSNVSEWLPDSISDPF